MTDPTALSQQAAAWHEINEVFRNRETPNGPGSTLEFTEPLRPWLSDLIPRRNIQSILDAPCGDWNWMQHVDLHGAYYCGWDLEQESIQANINRFAQPRVVFRQTNLLTEMHFPTVDLFICRDFLIHLPNTEVQHVLDKIYASHSRYLLTTNFRDDRNELLFDEPGRPGYWHRPINLEVPPFNLTGRVEALTEIDSREQVLFDLWADIPSSGGVGVRG